MSELADYKRGMGIGPLDRKLLSAAADGLSPKEIAGSVQNVISPEAVADRIKNLISSRDWLTPVERELLVIDQMNELVGMLRRGSEAGNTRSIEVSAKILKDKLEYLQKNRISAEDQAQIIQAGHASLMLQAISRSYEMAAEMLEQKFPQVPQHELRDAFMLCLEPAITEVEGRIV